MSLNVLVVEDEPAIRQMLCFALTNDGYATHEAANVDAAQSAIKAALPDLILLDWMLPGLSGLDFARRLRRESTTNKIPIIMLTAKGEEEEKVRALDIGADDFVTKPFSTRELLARIRAVIRRSSQSKTASGMAGGPFQIDPESKRATCAGNRLDLSPTEFRLLEFFISHPERVYTRSQLLDAVWGSDAYVEERTVDVHIRRLRKLLEPSATDGHIQTVRGVGYCFSLESR